MNQDGVSIAFDVMLEEIAAIENQLAAEGASAFQERRYKDADRLSQSGKRLLAFREKLEQLRDEWKSGIDIDTRKRLNVEIGYSIAPHTKGPKTKLRVSLASGRVIQRSNAAQTFVDVIEELGVDAVRRLGLSVNGIPLVDTKKDKKYNQTKRGGYFIITHSNTRTKKDLLERIGKRLGKPLKVEIV